jgi:hypothetical protein
METAPHRGSPCGMRGHQRIQHSVRREHLQTKMRTTGQTICVLRNRTNKQTPLNACEAASASFSRSSCVTANETSGDQPWHMYFSVDTSVSRSRLGGYPAYPATGQLHGVGKEETNK